jgi:four helix bundle protein
MQKDEKDLRQRTKDFALGIVRMFSALPKTTEAQVLGKQLLRSGTSIGANYREAYRGRSKAEFISKCGDCLREIEEWSDWDERHRRYSRKGSGERFGGRANQTAYWLELLVDCKIVSPDKLQPLRQECDELTAIFVTILKRSKEKPS